MGANMWSDVALHRHSELGLATPLEYLALASTAADAIIVIHEANSLTKQARTGACVYVSFKNQQHHGWAVQQ